MSRMRGFLLMNLRPMAGLAFIAVGFAASAAAVKDTVDFARDVLPVLSDNCFHCHGPDEKARKAKLRFDTKEGAFRLDKNGKSVLVPGKSSESEMIRRLTTSDPDDKMPPPDSNRKLTPRQIEILARWVDQGAKWGQHWAFQPVHVTPPLKTKRQNWARNEIDQYVLARLEKEGLPPAPQADKERLIRRVTLDLTGLPPTTEETDAFLADRSPKAYERVLDRLLASPRYGERMASDWLDIARYSDTHGYQMDRYRPMWPWRDWVIKAFNQNLPFDRFATWQLAGDLLPNATKDQRLATAFNRLHLQNEEGGIVEEEYRVAYVVDRVDTMGTAFLGLTFECSRCHDHKFDPLTMKDFYSMFSIFQNIDESGQTVYFGEVMPVPTLLLSDDATDARLSQLQRQIARKETALPALRQTARGAFEQWLMERGNEPGFPGMTGSFSFDEIKEGKVANELSSTKPANAVENPKLVPGRAGQAAELSGENGFTFPGLGQFTRADPFSFGIWVRTPVLAPRNVIFHKSRAWMDAGSRGYELLLEDGHVAVGLHHMWPGNAVKVRTKAAVPTNEWTHLAITYDGSSRAAGLKIYLNGLPAEVEVIRDGLTKDFTYGGDEPELTIGYRFRDSGFKDGQVDGFAVFNRTMTPLEVAALAGRDDLRKAWKLNSGSLTEDQRDGLLDFYLSNVYPPARQLRNELVALRREQNRVVEPVPEIMVMREMAEPKPAYMLKRGAYDAPGERVSANTPGFLPPLSKDSPRNRLGLANWLFAPGNPLTARVTVNRLWQMMLGKGIVETSDNFGSQGSPPTHPELLDWLANDFVNSGWDIKATLKKIALSATYQQSSKASADLLARDPANQLLARGPSRRLTAEMLRDQALADSGLLVEKLGGPRVRPYQPDGLWEVAMGAPRYDQGHGDDLHRRSLYTYWKRTVPPPAMVTFDAAERNVCLVRRQSTSTPLQALTLLNDPQITEAARHVSERMLREGGATTSERVAWAFRLITGRKPGPAEVEVLRRLYTEQSDLFAADQQAAAKVLAVGEASNDPALSPVELAAGAVLAKALFNHDEAVMRR
ncbi:MAG TPA: DUF1553 domain-containing protein [Verrucomicrobiae bacterium]|nr:DUF1553 domain-containing protein [Verrucomicrobiae bacterium]